jgi:hypothetical protein
VKRSRQDLSGYLWHFCREDKEPEKAIQSILAEKRIRSGLDRDTSEHVVCFTESPLEQIRRQAPDLRKTKFPRFSLFGIGFRKEFVFRQGGLPVIYQRRCCLRDPDFPKKLHWRHVDLDLSPGKGIDYSWMREWRVKGDFDFGAACDQAIVVVPEAGDFEGVLYNIEADGDWSDGQHEVFPSYEVFWNFVSLSWHTEPIDDARIEVASRQRNTP